MTGAYLRLLPAYMLIAGSDRRVALIRELRPRLARGAPILVWFFTRTASAPRYRMITAVANAIADSAAVRRSKSAMT